MHVEENKVGAVLLDECEGFETILALADEIDLRKTFEKIGELVARRFFVVND